MVLPPSFPDPWPKLCKPRGRGSGEQLRVNSPEHRPSRALTTRAWFTRCFTGTSNGSLLSPGMDPFPRQLSRAQAFISHTWWPSVTSPRRWAMLLGSPLGHTYWCMPLHTALLSLLTCGPGQVLGLWRLSRKWGTFSPGCCELPVKTELFRALSLLLLLEK